ncbi:hypothetical protein [Streptomyces sp. NBC_00316]|uniref:hypothetical protein n=1 Tax=Streptomyces sp. NBC_00316 TaxID=2975710 RepID=UPI002E2DA567|nr:hypothetical protein [Streptomyces sp. NBC_00316]
MADISFGIFVLLFMVAVSLFSVRAAWLHWADSDRAPDAATHRYSTNPSVIRGHERGIVALAGWLMSMTIGIVAATAAAGGAGPAVEEVGAFFILGSFPLLMLHATIVWFNWPKFLVPPHQRSETGSVIEWWRHRRDFRAAIKEAGQRDTQGQHSTDPPKQT